ncbi:MAG TPA: hypothetical protein VGM88_04270 [Kofleriaceae bacterium]|jgi:hypothetical protein
MKLKDRARAKDARRAARAAGGGLEALLQKAADDATALHNGDTSVIDAGSPGPDSPPAPAPAPPVPPTTTPPKP